MQNQSNKRTLDRCTILEEYERNKLEEMKEKTLRNVNKYAQKSVKSNPHKLNYHHGMQQSNVTNRSGIDSNALNMTTKESMTTNNLYYSSNNTQNIIN